MFVMQHLGVLVTRQHCRLPAVLHASCVISPYEMFGSSVLGHGCDIVAAQGGAVCHTKAAASDGLPVAWSACCVFRLQQLP